ncbi:hypothetical protein GCM10009663_55780 [Kitasatospora arboriphila]|uniref:Uncharacterized protein n=1 Tax=Kitasatospora arboriphila TaxID=258052 RepID=A0ABN1TXW7_9ACTN
MDAGRAGEGRAGAAVAAGQVGGVDPEFHAAIVLRRAARRNARRNTRRNAYRNADGPGPQGGRGRRRGGGGGRRPPPCR